MNDHTASGMRMLLIAVAMVVLGYVSGKGGLSPFPQPTPAPPRGPDMVAVFSANQNKAEAKQHAALFGTICSKVADTLEADAKRAEQRRLATGIDLAKYRADLRYYTTSGWSFSASYPNLKTQVETWLDAEAGKNPSTMTEEDTRRWVAAFRGLADTSLYAARVIK